MASTTLTTHSYNGSQLPAQADQESSKLYNLANSTVAECMQEVQLSDLNTVVLLLREALIQRPAPHPRRLNSLGDLAAALVIRFAQTIQSEDLDEAILLRLEALEIEIIEPQSDTKQCHDVADSDDQESTTMTVLAKSTLTQFHQSVQVSSLDKAVSLLRNALLLQPGLHVKRPATLNRLAMVLFARFNRTSQLEDLDEAILLYHEALELLSEDRSDFLDNLCAALLTRFGKTHQPQDFSDAVMLRSQVLGFDLEESDDQSELYEIPGAE